MRMYDIIKNKRDGGTLSGEELQFFISGYLQGEIPDYQVSALLMAIYFKGMKGEECKEMTRLMATSGDMADLSQISGVTLDKHSTGGVGDKTTLIVAPLVACLGGKVAKMSGKGLGHTGGTIDKLLSIKGYNPNISKDEFIKIVNDVGVSIIGSTENFSPVDKKLYALRDVTATVDSAPLIATSIMSKKIASGSSAIVLDVKVGSGAFNKTYEIGENLAKLMVEIGKGNGRKMTALITNMDVPLGKNIGNSLEVIEAVDVLKGKGDENLTEISLRLASSMLALGGFGDEDTCYKSCVKAINSGLALDKLAEMVKAHGGEQAYIYDTSKFELAKLQKDIKAEKSGYIFSIDTEKVGVSSAILGSGRTKKDDIIDYGTGIIIYKTRGDKVLKGDVIARFFAKDERALMEAEKVFLNSYSFSDEKPESQKLILGKVI